MMNTNQKSRSVNLGALALVALLGLGIQASVVTASEDQEIPSNLAIDMKRAIEIAKGVGGGPVTEIELEQEDGNWVYEARMKLSNGDEKEILIDTQTGKVLKVETEHEKGKHEKKGKKGKHEEKDND